MGGVFKVRLWYLNVPAIKVNQINANDEDDQ